MIEPALYLYNRFMENAAKDIFEEAERPILITERMFDFAEFLYGGRLDEEEESRDPSEMCVAIPHDNHPYEVEDPLAKLRRTARNQ